MSGFPIGVVTMLAALLVAFTLAGLWWWVGFLVAFSILLGIVERLAVRKTGLTLSGQVTRWMEKRPWAGGLLAAVLGGAMGYLIYHLATGH